MKAVAKSLAKSFLLGFLKGVQAELQREQARQQGVRQHTAPTPQQQAALVRKDETEVARFHGLGYQQWQQLPTAERIRKRDEFYRAHRL